MVDLSIDTPANTTQNKPILHQICLSSTASRDRNGWTTLVVWTFCAARKYRLVWAGVDVDAWVWLGLFVQVDVTMGLADRTKLLVLLRLNLSHSCSLTPLNCRSWRRIRWNGCWRYLRDKTCGACSGWRSFGVRAWICLWRNLVWLILKLAGSLLLILFHCIFVYRILFYFFKKLRLIFKF